MMRCESCKGRGARGFRQRRPDSFPDAIVCKACGGLGEFCLAELARLLRVAPNDVYRVRDLKAGALVGARVFDAITSRFPEALTS